MVRGEGDVFLMSASSSGGGTSAFSSVYEQAQSTIDPFLSASSGKPAPTCHSCEPLVVTEMPASRDCCTMSIHVLSEASVEMLIDVGMAEASPAIAWIDGPAVPAPTCQMVCVHSQMVCVHSQMGCVHSQIVCVHSQMVCVSQSDKPRIRSRWFVGDAFTASGVGSQSWVC